MNTESWGNTHFSTVTVHPVGPDDTAQSFTDCVEVKTAGGFLSFVKTEENRDLVAVHIFPLTALRHITVTRGAQRGLGR